MGPSNRELLILQVKKLEGIQYEQKDFVTDASYCGSL